MSERQWILFFKDEAARYSENVFTRNTVAEVDFIARELGLREGQSVLDVGCGTGRHCIELAGRGYRCTGIDQSPEMLSEARTAAKEAGVEATFVLGDASSTRLSGLFDHVICLCEGAFSLVEPGVDPVPYHEDILGNIHAMLRPGGRFLLTALNGLRMIREHDDHSIADGRFDPTTITVTETHPGPEGSPVTVVEKGFLPSELRQLLESTGFEVLAVWGGTAGDWNKQAVRLDEIEVMALAGRRPQAEQADPGMHPE